MKNSLLVAILLLSTHLTAQINQAKVYWVGHSLMSHTDAYSSGSDNLIGLMSTLVSSQGKTYNFHKHTTPGAPLGWNWGANASAWSDISFLMPPLMDATDPDYGTFDVMVITEGVNLYPSYQWWSSSFYARKFFNAARTANPNTRLFLYESWHHFQASDDGLRDYYGPMASFDWRQYMLDVRPLWETIIDQASDPAQTQPEPDDYVYQGAALSPTDPGLGNAILPINIIPTGQVLVHVLDRLATNLATDDWTYNGSPLSSIDFFYNPLSNFPADLITTVHPTDPVDDIHPSNVLIYLNALVHYAVVYQDNPVNLPAANGVPANIADIFKEVVWDVVTNDPRTGVSAPLAVNYLAPLSAKVDGQQVKLSWLTSSEINSDYFEIQRSIDARNWHKVGTVPAKNQSSQLAHYAAIDSTPIEGYSYYRLKQLDLDGTFSYSNWVGVHIENTSFILYPNPAQSYLHVDVNRRLSYQIFNAVGKLMLAGDANDINIQTLPTGFYFLRIGDAMVKFVKE